MWPTATEVKGVMWPLAMEVKEVKGVKEVKDECLANSFHFYAS